jgi:circadian clock protein KaiC
LLEVVSSRPTHQGLEMHLLQMHRKIREHRPRVVVVDPVTNLIAAGNLIDTKSMLTRLIDFLKSSSITVVLTSLTSGGRDLEATDVGISSIIDTWIILKDLELGGERNRAIQVLKARGVPHSNQVREFLVTPDGIRLVDPYLGPSGVLTGSARLAQEAADRERDVARRLEAEIGEQSLRAKRKSLEAQMASLQAEAELVGKQLSKAATREQERQERESRDKTAMAFSRREAGIPVREAARGKSRNGGGGRVR